MLPSNFLSFEVYFGVRVAGNAIIWICITGCFKQDNATNMWDRLLFVPKYGSQGLSISGKEVSWGFDLNLKLKGGHPRSLNSCLFNIPGIGVVVVFPNNACFLVNYSRNHGVA